MLATGSLSLQCDQRARRFDLGSLVDVREANEADDADEKDVGAAQRSVPVTASASISINISGSMRACTCTMVVAGG